MKASEFDKELAELRVEQERDAAIGRIRASLDRPGATTCRRCGDPIDERRRQALPSAVTCIDCASEGK
ncbi:TraR/DksA C4-type zinc finger protein [Stappia sp. F7233]|uniref:TraR/DksA C4-type zinc finger protein n=1 Tax=Stappia albiluteola TaxID=2758565 RepID=A0A839AES2_9HYPH|nr:TraR/DksA C4-type zinc finger protein [Stappia albiluteola]MBA5777460.1 TraR/DksA C4-type zinc finger protein [Stappia albiluteola]MBA5777498.1 TraR/DksA C4-type zinc finger protein [Stappia albiluteola]MBA5778091.1 TraR/DksA C4-type zinc finger protein [Stappia albiluteola]MBA5778132.1 TraR/DksA C4-type zinc finger protein [Stappia albiluteola]